jgi:hypothetical protein
MLCNIDNEISFILVSDTKGSTQIEIGWELDAEENIWT